MTETLLAVHLRDRGIHQSAVAAALGVSSSTVTRWCSGERLPTHRFALEIEKFTGKAIPSTYWLGLTPVRPERRHARRLARSAS